MRGGHSQAGHSSNAERVAGAVVRSVVWQHARGLDGVRGWSEGSELFRRGNWACPSFDSSCTVSHSPLSPFQYESDGAGELELRHFVDGVDQVDALVAVEVALVDGVDAQEAGPPALRARHLAERRIDVGQ